MQITWHTTHTAILRYRIKANKEREKNKQTNSRTKQDKQTEKMSRRRSSKKKKQIGRKRNDVHKLGIQNFLIQTGLFIFSFIIFSLSFGSKIIIYLGPFIRFRRHKLTSRLSSGAGWKCYKFICV